MPESTSTTGLDTKGFSILSDGSIKRRMLGGSVMAFLCLPLFWDEGREITEAAGLGNATIAATGLLLLYGLGVIIEIVGESLFLKAFGGGLWGATFPVRRIYAETFATRWVLRGTAYYLIAPPCVIWGFVRGLFGTSLYRDCIESRLVTPEGRAAFDSLPDFVRQGLSDPYGDGFESAWEYVVCGLDDHRAQVRRFQGRNKDLLVILSALVLALGVYAGMDLDRLLARGSAIAAYTSKFGIDPHVLIPLGIILPAALFALHHRLVVAGIVNCIELAALPSRNPASTPSESDA